MGTVIRYEAGLILLSLSTGAWLMMIYDTLRVFRLAIPHRPWAIGMEDFFLLDWSISLYLFSSLRTEWREAEGVCNRLGIRGDDPLRPDCQQISL